MVWPLHKPTPRTSAVNLNVFNDGYTNMAGPSDAVFINSSGQACIPNGQANGTCPPMVWRGTTADGSDATCTIFGNGYTNQSVPADAVFINAANRHVFPMVRRAEPAKNGGAAVKRTELKSATRTGRTIILSGQQRSIVMHRIESIQSQ